MARFSDHYRSMTVWELQQEKAAIEEELRMRDPSLYRTDYSAEETKGDVLTHDPVRPPCAHERLNDHGDACLDCGAIYSDGKWQ